MDLCVNRSKLVLMFSSVSRGVVASFLSFVYYTRSSQKVKIILLGLPVFLDQLPKLKLTVFIF